jgi:endonuclease/exonuclease/phosphatase family metal-dependent hydrolase
MHRVVAFALMLAACSSPKPFRVATYNILCSACSLPEGFMPWGVRRALVVHTLRAANPDLIGLEEVDDDQLADLLSDFSDYDFRTSTMAGDEHTVLMARRDRFHMGPSTELYVDDPPDARTRSVLWADAGELRIAVTHLSGLKSEIQRVDIEVAQLRPPVVLVGDFNAFAGPNRWEVPEYESILTGSGLLKEEVTLTASTAGERSDWILGSPSFLSKGAKLWPNTKASDHPAVSADLVAKEGS